MKSRKVVEMDVREEIRKGREPFALIMQAVSRLKSNEDLKLIAPFQPLPMISMLNQQGFFHTSVEMPNGDWEVYFSRQPGQDRAPADSANVPAESGKRAPVSSGNEVVVDARGLEPPQPMVAILEAIVGLPEGAVMKALTDRRPMHLYAQLEQRGFTGETTQQQDGSYVTYVRRA